MHLRLVDTGALGEAAQLEAAGEYHRALIALGNRWLGPGTSPRLEGLSDHQRAHWLLRTGSLSGWLGSLRQLEGTQESAKDLLTRSIRLFEELGDHRGAAEAEKCLGVCYWREGAFDEARIVLNRACNRLNERSDLWLTVLLNLALVERSTDRPHIVFGIYNSLEPYIDSASHAVKAMFFNGRALQLKRSGKLDQALIDYAAASYHYRRAGHNRFSAKVEQNIAGLLLTAREFELAHQHLDQAEITLERLQDRGALAELWDTRATLLMAENRLTEALRYSQMSVDALAIGEQSALLVDSLVTHAKALSLLGERSTAFLAYDRALKIAQERVSEERARKIGAIMLEEISLAICHSSGLALQDAVDKFERAIIRAALLENDGKVGAAASRLGITQQALSWILDHKFTDLRLKPKRRTPQFKKPSSSSNSTTS